MADLRVYRSPWGDFPNVVIQTIVTKLRSRPAYDAAKRGGGEAVFEVIKELVKPEKIRFTFDCARRWRNRRLDLTGRGREPYNNSERCTPDEREALRLQRVKTTAGGTSIP